MQLSLRPYLTAGVAIAGASVIAVAPIQPTPTDIQIPNPSVQVERAVQLTANEIETAWNDLVFRITELGLSLTVPLTAAVIEAIAGDLLPFDPEVVATGLLLGLSGYAISGGGSIGTALQDVVDGFGVDFGTGLVALLIGAPSTIIEGYVVGGFGPNLAPLLGIPMLLKVFAGGLIQNPGLVQGLLPLGIQLCSSPTGCPNVGTGLTFGNAVLPSLNSTLGTLLQGLLNAVDIGGLSSGGGLLGGLLDNLNLPGLGLFGSSEAGSDMATINTFKTTNEEQNLVTLNVPDQPDPKLDTAIDPGGRAVEALKSVKVPPQGQAREGIQKALDNVANAGPKERVKLNVEKVNPLDRSSAKDDTETDNPSASHRPDKETVSDSDVEKVNAGVGKGRDKKNDDGDDSGDTE